MVFTRIPVEIFSAQFANINLVYDVNRCVVKCVWIIRLYILLLPPPLPPLPSSKISSLCQTQLLVIKSPTAGVFSQEGFLMVIYQWRIFVCDDLSKFTHIHILGIKLLLNYNAIKNRVLVLLKCGIDLLCITFLWK